MWTCPKCNRKFKSPNQSHSCGTFIINTVFEKYPIEIYNLFEMIYAELKTFGNMQVRPVKNGVMFSVHSTFLALKPHSKYLAIEFYCKKKYDEFPIEKCVQVSKIGFAHIMRVQEVSEIDTQLFEWLKESYLFDKSRN